MKNKWIPITVNGKCNFNIDGKHEGLPVIVWNTKSNLPEITAYYSSSPNNYFSDGTYSHFIVAPENPNVK